MTRIISSPHRDIAPLRSISPDWYLAQVNPNTAPTDLDFRKRAGTSTVARYVNATTGPTPGTVIRRRHTSSSRTTASKRPCRMPSCSRSTRRTTSSGSTSTAKSGKFSISSYNARFEPGGSHHADLETEVAQGAAQIIVDGNGLRLQ